MSFAELNARTACVYSFGYRAFTKMKQKIVLTRARVFWYNVCPMSSEEKEQHSPSGKETRSSGGSRQRPVPPTGVAGGSRSGWAVLIAVAMAFLIMQFMDRGREPMRDALSQTELRALVSADEVKSLVRVRRMDSGSTWLEGERRGGSKFRVNLVPGENESLMDFLSAQHVSCPVREEEPMFGPFLQQLLIFGVFAALLWIFFYRKVLGGAGGPLSFGKSKARLLNEDKAKKRVTFADVAGVDEAKEDVQEIVEFLKEPAKFTKLGGRIPKGVLLVGPPGTGKTLLAKAIAGEAKVPFFSISGSDFEEMFVGVGASRVRDMFEQGKKNAPCIIFIDEIDAVGQRRSSAASSAGRYSNEQTLNAMLVEMDGFDANEGVIIIAATNRPDILDPALLRPGRFDRRVHVELPTVKGREDILRLHAAKVKLAPDADLSRLARGTSGHSGADLANIINEAALLAARQGLEAITHAVLEEARDKVFWGSERKSAGYSKKEYETTAWHEAGHALLQLLVANADPLHKVSIIPRGSALGVTMTLPEKDVLNRTRSYFIDELSVLCGGRIAEEIHTGEISTGASQDIAMATNIARDMVCRFGMSSSFGFQSFYEISPFAVEEQPPRLSQKTAEAIDAEVARLVSEGYSRAKKLIEDNKDKLELLATTLLEKETMDGRDVEKLLGLERPEPEAHEDTLPQSDA